MLKSFLIRLSLPAGVGPLLNKQQISTLSIFDGVHDEPRGQPASSSPQVNT